jgi:amino acid transporter
MADSIGVPESTVEEGGLKRAIGPRLLLLFIVGDMLGTGIYARVGGVAGQVGGIIWLSFLVAFILAGLTACAYAELVTKYPGAAGAALYANRAFRNGLFTFMVAFAVVMSGVASAGAAARAFGGDYLAQVFGTEFSASTTVLVAVLFVVGLSVINFIGISESLKTNMVLTIIELSGLLIIILIGLLAIFGGTAQPARSLEFSGEGAFALAVLAGASVAFYALIGFEDSVNVAEETENPSRSFPRALFFGIAIAGVVYLAVAFVAAAVVNPARLAEEGQTAPLLLVVDQGPLAIPLGLFSIFALVAITNTALANLIMGSRVIYGMAREGVLPAFFGRVHPGRRTPYVSIIFVALVLLALVATGDLGGLADTTVLLLLLVFAIVNVSVLVLKRQQVSHSHFRAPAFIPVLAIGVIGLLLIRFIEDLFQGGDGLGVIVRAAVLLFIGFVLWLLSWLTGGNRERPEGPDRWA